MYISSQITSQNSPAPRLSAANTPHPPADFAMTLAATPATVRSSAGTVSSGADDDPATIYLPTRENVGRLARHAQTLLASKLRTAGIPADPAFSLIEADPNTGHITVRGDRPDAATIEQLINEDHALSLAIHNVHGMASHLPAMEAGAAYSSAWQAATSDQARMAIFEYYRALMNSLRSDCQMSFSGRGLAFSLNGSAIPIPA